MVTKEEKFYNSLKDVFIGEKIEGESGYINLMKIKSRYYERGILPKLKEYIDKATKDFPDFREELFDKLYTFFNRYFSRSGSIYFDYTPLYQSVYEKIYTDDKDVILFWKTCMLYYVKTDRIFRNLKTEVDGFKFFFDVSSLEHKKATEKRELIYELKEAKEDGTVVFNVLYTEKGRKTKIDQIIKELKKKDIKIKSGTLERAFRVFERQSEVDYFINKNAKEFLREQFDLWLYQYVFKGKSEWTEKRIKQLQVLKDIAYKIIDFISQFEDELVKIWNKPKFVFNSNYVITLDRILNPPSPLMGEDKGGGEQRLKIIKKILNHKNFKEQVKEWKELGIIEDKLKESDLRKEILKEDLTGKNLNERYKFLPIDTKYFKDLEIEILSLFDNLDESLDGWLIKSENYQALNTILPKFKEKIKVIYIDPPYNTGSDEFLYQDKFRHSTWLTMMENRLKLAKKVLKDEGVIFVSVDDNELANLNHLMDSIFERENFITNIVWEGGLKNDSRFVSVSQDYIVTYVKNKEKLIQKDERWRTQKEGIDEIYKQVDRLKEKYGENYEKISIELKEWYRTLPKGHPAKAHAHYNMVDERGIFFPGDISWPGGGGPLYDVIHPLTGEPVAKPKGGWRFATAEKMQRAIREGRILFGPDETTIPNVKRYLHETEGQVLPAVFYKDRRSALKQIRDLMGGDVYANPKDPYILGKLIEATNTSSQIVLDFFAGSGTTAHAVMKLNKEDKGSRKFILVEMADYFFTIIIPRIKKLAYSFDWKDGKPQDSDGEGIFVKYYELEQYEDVLRKAKYEDSNLFENPDEDPYTQYIFMKDPKMLDALEIDYENNKVKIDLSKLYSKERDGKEIDIAETLSNLLGKWIKKITNEYVEFEDGIRVSLKNLDYVEMPGGEKETFYKVIKSLIWW